MKCSKSLGFLGLRPRPRGGAYYAPGDPLVARGFLPSAIAASRLRRLQFPHGLKSNSIKEGCPMRLGGICARGLRGGRRPCISPDFSSSLSLHTLWKCQAEFTRGYPETTQLNLYSPNFLTAIGLNVCGFFNRNLMHAQHRIRSAIPSYLFIPELKCHKLLIQNRIYCRCRHLCRMRYLYISV